MSSWVMLDGKTKMTKRRLEILYAMVFTNDVEWHEERGFRMGSQVYEYRAYLHGHNITSTLRKMSDLPNRMLKHLPKKFSKYNGVGFIFQVTQKGVDMLLEHYDPRGNDGDTIEHFRIQKAFRELAFEGRLGWEEGVRSEDRHRVPYHQTYSDDITNL